MSPRRSNSIEAMGLKKYLDSTKERHNNEGYDRFVFYLDKKITKPGIGRIFNVSPETIKNWRIVYRKEQS